MSRMEKYVSKTFHHLLDSYQDDDFNKFQEIVKDIKETFAERLDEITETYEDAEDIIATILNDISDHLDSSKNHYLTEFLEDVGYGYFNANWDPILFKVVKNNNTEVTKLILEKMENLELIDYEENDGEDVNVFSKALNNNNTEIFKLLVEKFRYNVILDKIFYHIEMDSIPSYSNKYFKIFIEYDNFNISQRFQELKKGITFFDDFLQRRIIMQVLFMEYPPRFLNYGNYFSIIMQNRYSIIFSLCHIPYKRIDLIPILIGRHSEMIDEFMTQYPDIIECLRHDINIIDKSYVSKQTDSMYYLVVKNDDESIVDHINDWCGNNNLLFDTMFGEKNDSICLFSAEKYASCTIEGCNGMNIFENMCYVHLSFDQHVNFEKLLKS